MIEENDKPYAVMLMGPTAAGKTDLAIRLVETFPLDIISVDSAMVYKGMDIGTAKPDAEERARAPHRLIDILDPAEPYSAARFREDALQEMRVISSQGRVPLLVGGTMLYFRALLDGLSQLPSSDEEVRAELEKQMQAKGLEYLHQRLAAVDPDAASRIHPNDPQRTIRALEVYELTGRALSVLQRENQQESLLPFRVIKIGLIPSERAVLHERIALRFMKMLQLGFVEEVKTLYHRGDLNVQLPSIRAVGYRQVWSYLEGSLDYNEMVEKGIIATRQLAKRQFTWLRSEKNIQFFDSLDDQSGEQVLKSLERDLFQVYWS